MTYDEIAIIAKRLDKNTKKQIDLDVEERMEILRQGNLTEKELEKMEDNLYMSLVLQEYLSGEYELLEEEKALLLAEMEELYNEYMDLLTKAKLEKKLNKKKMMALELMKIREQLLKHKKTIARVKADLKATKKEIKNLEEKSSKEKMKKVAMGMDDDLGVAEVKSQKKDEYSEYDIRRIARDEVSTLTQEQRKQEEIRENNKRHDANSLFDTQGDQYQLGSDNIENGAASKFVGDAIKKYGRSNG